MDIPRHVRVKLINANGVVTDVKIEEVQQVIKFVDGYPSPPQWEVVRILTEDEVKQLGVTFVQEQEMEE